MQSQSEPGDQLGNDARPKPSRQFTDLLSRALLDKELRYRLFKDPEAIARALDLPPAEARALKLLDPSRFEETVAWLRWG